MSQAAILNRAVPVWSVGLVAAVFLGVMIIQQSSWLRTAAPEPALARPQQQSSGDSSLPWLPIALVGLVAAGLAGTGLMMGRKQPAARPSLQGKPLTAEAVAKAATVLDLEVTKIDEMVMVYLGGSARSEQSLAAMQGKIGQVETKEQLRAIASLLLAENTRMRRDAQDLSQKLDASRSQVQSLRTSLEHAQEEGLRDALTSIGNRRCFDTTLAKAIETAQSTETPLSIIFADIDRFKSVNDTHGHPVGDECLKILARLLTRIAREGDVVTRYGGEEFAIILPNTPNMRAGILAERFRSELEAENLKLRDSNQALKITASFGVAQLRSAESSENLVKRADTRLYKAKQLGRNRVVTM